jgi:hypothetical protein
VAGSWILVLISGRASRNVFKRRPISGYFFMTLPSKTVTAHKGRSPTIERTFSPEFRNRLDARIGFNALSPDVMGQIGLAVGAPDGAVLAQNRALLLGRQPGEGPRAAQRIPDRPRPGGIEDGAPGPAQEPVLQILLVAARIGPADHGEGRLGSERRERLRAEDLPEFRHEERRILGDGEHGDSARILEIGVEHGLDLAALERAGESLGLRTASEGLELHEEAAVRALTVRAALGDVHLDLLARGPRRLTHRGTYPPRVCISR